MRVLGIETSCDETGVAVYDDQQGLLAHALHSQTTIHVEFGGVVPELASRDHIRKVLPLVKRVMNQTRLQSHDIDGIAYTAGPGLLPALLVGAAIGRSLAWGWGIPSLGIHHMEAHLLASMLEDTPPAFPFLALLVSGGHTLLMSVKGLGDYHVLGETLDDAVGEAFDKTAKLLGLPYPGGPVLATLAEKGDVKRFRFPRPMIDHPGLDFSFSGLKTFALNTFQKEGDDEQTKADIARAFEDAVVDVLTIKCQRALKQTQLKQLVIAGGVSANQCLRRRLNDMVRQENAEAFYPRIEFCTDNGAMIAYAGCQRLKAGYQDDGLGINVQARWDIENIKNSACLHQKGH